MKTINKFLHKKHLRQLFEVFVKQIIYQKIKQQKKYLVLLFDF